MGELAKLPNLGKVNEQKLQEAGIDTPEQFLALGTKEVFLRLRRNDPGACLHLLYALEGAAEGIRKTELSPEKKAELREFFKAVERGEIE